MDSTYTVKDGSPAEDKTPTASKFVYEGDSNFMFIPMPMYEYHMVDLEEDLTSLSYNEGRDGTYIVNDTFTEVALMEHGFDSVPFNHTNWYPMSSTSNEGFLEHNKDITCLEPVSLEFSVDSVKAINIYLFHYLSSESGDEGYVAGENTGYRFSVTTGDTLGYLEVSFSDTNSTFKTPYVKGASLSSKADSCDTKIKLNFEIYGGNEFPVAVITLPIEYQDKTITSITSSYQYKKPPLPDDVMYEWGVTITPNLRGITLKLTP